MVINAIIPDESAYSRLQMVATRKPTIRTQMILSNLGENIRQARILRRLPMKIVAGRAGISIPTLQRLEEGHHGVAVGVLVSVLNALGLSDGIEEMASLGKDKVGLAMLSARLPRRARRIRMSSPDNLGTGRVDAPMRARPKKLRTHENE